MTAAIWVLSVLLVAEFIVAPINLWTGRAIPMFTGFTGCRPVIARRVLAPVQLAAAVLVAAGVAARPGASARRWAPRHWPG